MKKHIFIAVLLIFGISAVGKAQSATFTDLNPDARSFAMGNSGYALRANAFSIFNNTAAIAFESNMVSAGYSYNHLMPSKNEYSGAHVLGGYYRISTRHSVALGAKLYMEKDVVAGGPLGDTLGFYNPQHLAINVGYAYRINDIFSVAANLRYISSDIFDAQFDPTYKTGSAFAGDVSFLYKEKSLMASLGVYNIGSKIDYGFNKYNLSSHVKGGVSYEWMFERQHYLTGSAQASYLFNGDDVQTNGIQSFVAGIGAEYSYQKMYSARLGYYMGGEESSYMTVGVGAYVGPVVIDFAYVIGGERVLMKNSFVVGVSVNF